METHIPYRTKGMEVLSFFAHEGESWAQKLLSEGDGSSSAMDLCSRSRTHFLLGVAKSIGKPKKRFYNICVDIWQNKPRSESSCFRHCKNDFGGLFSMYGKDFGMGSLSHSRLSDIGSHLAIVASGSCTKQTITKSWKRYTIHCIYGARKDFD